MYLATKPSKRRTASATQRGDRRRSPRAVPRDRAAPTAPSNRPGRRTSPSAAVAPRLELGRAGPRCRTSGAAAGPVRKRGNRVEQQAAVADHADAEILEVLGRQLRQHPHIDAVCLRMRARIARSQATAATPRCPSSPPATTDRRLNPRLRLVQFHGKSISIRAAPLRKKRLVMIRSLCYRVAASPPGHGRARPGHPRGCPAQGRA